VVISGERAFWVAFCFLSWVFSIFSLKLCNLS
jgi:hypothetical protein